VKQCTGLFLTLFMQRMLRIDDVIFSLDIIEKKFRCNLVRCQGLCCRYGDSGAVLTAAEGQILQEIWPVVKPFLRKEGIEVIEKVGTSVVDSDNDRVTPLIDNKECAYTIIEKNIFKCGIEKAWEEGKILFQKPLSCHLFPAKIKHFSGFTAVNYQELAICKSALSEGKAKGTFLYQFLKEPLTRAFGEKIYEELCIAAEEIKKNRNY